MAIEFRDYDDPHSGRASFIDTPELLHIHLSEFAPGDELTVTLDRAGAERLQEFLNGIEMLQKGGT